MLFAEDEPKMDVDEENTSGLVAKAKITQFEVKTFSYLTSAGRFSHKCDTLCYNSAGFFFFLKEPETQNDPESLPVGQMKARRIIESFENPFRMVRDDQR